MKDEIEIDHTGNFTAPVTLASQPATLVAGAPESQPRETRCAVSQGSPAPGCVRAELPREYVVRLLANKLIDLRKTAEVMSFNVEHKQWDLLMHHLQKLPEAEAVIRNCTEALAQENTTLSHAGGEPPSQVCSTRVGL